MLLDTLKIPRLQQTFRTLIIFYTIIFASLSVNLLKQSDLF